MNQRQAKQIVCATAMHLIFGNLPTQDMSDEDAQRIDKAVDDLVGELWKRSGLPWPVPGEFEEIVKAVTEKPQCQPS